MRRIFFFLSILLFVLNPVAFSQDEKSDETSYRAEMFSSFSTGEHTPFWMVYHNWGMTPLDANNFYTRGGVFHKQRLDREWSFSLGIDIAASTPHSYGTFWVQQAFGELDWKMFRLNIGSKEDYTSLLDPFLSSGDFDKSNNARPLPELKLSMPAFCRIPGARNIYFKGDFAVGKYLDGDWQEDKALPHNESYTKDILSHHKSIAFRFGDISRSNRWQFTVEMDHQVQWGGVLYQYEWWKGEYKIQDQPQGLDDFFRGMIAKEGSGGASSADNAYVSGSQVGSYLFRLDHKLKNEEVLSLYLHHFFDDGSGMVFENYRDMLLGVQYKTTKKQLISNAVFEYIYTKHQTGPIHFNMMMDEAHSHLQNRGNGNDNYYNNVDYIQGRSYYGRTMGTPLFLSPEYNDDGRLNFKGTRIISFHAGLEGYFHPHFSYRILATTGQNWGRYYLPFLSIHKGFAANLDLTYDNPRLKGFSFQLSTGANSGRFFSEDAFGMGLTIVKRGIIRAR